MPHVHHCFGQLCLKAETACDFVPSSFCSGLTPCLLQTRASRIAKSLSNVLGVAGMDAADGAKPDQAYRPLRALLAEQSGAAPQAPSALESIQGAQVRCTLVHAKACRCPLCWSKSRLILWREI